MFPSPLRDVWLLQRSSPPDLNHTQKISVKISGSLLTVCSLVNFFLAVWGRMDAARAAFSAVISMVRLISRG